MARLVGIRQVWTFIAGYAVALGAVLLGPPFALRLAARQASSTGTALLAVSIGALSFVPLIALIVWMYRRSDEYERHGMLLYSSIAFMLAFIVIAALDVLAPTGLFKQWLAAPRWWTMLACWMIAMLGVHVARRRAQ